MHCWGNEPSRQRQAGRQVIWLAGMAESAGLQLGRQRPAVLSSGECIVLLVWAWSTWTQVNSKPIIRRAIWLWESTRVAFAASWHYSEVHYIKVQPNTSSTLIKKWIQSWKILVNVTFLLLQTMRALKYLWKSQRSPVLYEWNTFQSFIVDDIMFFGICHLPKCWMWKVLWRSGTQ